MGVEDLKDKVKVVLTCPSVLFQYAVLLVIIFILEISAGIAGYVYHGEVGPYLDSRSVNILIVKYCKPIFIRLRDIREVRKGVIIANH